MPYMETDRCDNWLAPTHASPVCSWRHASYASFKLQASERTPSGVLRLNGEVQNVDLASRLGL